MAIQQFLNDSPLLLLGRILTQGNLIISIKIWLPLALQGMGRDLGKLPVKWICPTAPTRPVPIFARLPGRAWFDPRDVSEEDTSPDSQGLNETAALIAQIFSREPCDVKLGIGGFSIGAAACSIRGPHTTFLAKMVAGLRFLENLSSVIVLSGWLPFYKLCHDTCGAEMLEMCSWLNEALKLQGW
ncbi:uncharacterized protein LOC131004813 [Salvia miltiorrhiza]|uniref:uncharacterized protein LOC131004813 n=1 Tax=Salvia miltiorrhiza TaxID=226208 RepID=UPI0025AB74E9|nr:uncharacterized protein LOC131004813 [Salvia miltiorrhiza]